MRKSECGMRKKEGGRMELGPAVVPDERYYGAARMWKAEKIRPKNAARGSLGIEGIDAF